MIKKMTFVLALTTLVAASTITPAFASHRTKVCGDTPESATINGGSFRQILVPEDAECTLTDVLVERDVVVLEGGRLTVLGSTIGDDLRADRPASILIDCRPAEGACVEDTSIGDDVNIEGASSNPEDPEGGDPIAENRICNTVIGDDLEIEESGENAPWQIGGFAPPAEGEDPRPECRGANGAANVVHDDVEIEHNRAPVTIDNNDIVEDLEVEDNTALVTIRNNDIGDDLDCEDNTPAPQGHSNSVGDDARDQCSGSAFTSPPPPPSP